MKIFLSQLKALQFDNRLHSLPIEEKAINKPRKVIGYCFSEVTPEQKENPRLIAYSEKAFSLIDVKLDPNDLENVQILAGNKLIENSRPIAHCYYGYQFGNWAGQLGDGRAIILGDLKGYELQLKGAGMTPYSRFADGRAVVRSSIREYLCSEAMFHLGIPTTRAASLIVSDTKAERDILYNGNPKLENCAVVLRIAETFIRFGSFEGGQQQELWEYCLKNHFQNSQNPFLEIVTKTARLCALWQCYGFCHGVLNTDNMSIIGLTIDYGPFAFIDYFNKNHISNHSDKEGRYSYENQPGICYWNLMKLCDALQFIIPQEVSKKILMDNYWEHYYTTYYTIMLKKLGLKYENTKSQQILIDSFFSILNQCCTNYTKVFQLLQQINIPYQTDYEECELNQEDEQIIQQLVQLSAPREVYISKRKPSLSKQQIDQFVGMAAQSPQLLAMMGINDSWLQQQVKQSIEYEKLQIMPEQERQKVMKLLWTDWVCQYKTEPNLINRQEIMQSMNPQYTLTNTILQKVIEEVENNNNYELLQKVQNVIENPFKQHKDMDYLFDQICNEDICISCSS